jgi:flavin reductase (DIM6/NTAB) family NADH-FMN oxidoreductase RutF
MRKFPGAVSVITAEHDGVRAGMTATAVMSLTAEPPQLAVALNQQASALPCIVSAGSFGINALAYDQDSIGDRFAGAGGVKGEARFAGADWTKLATGAPILERAAVSFDCTLRTQYEIDTHVILIGAVKAVKLGSTDRQLLYVDGSWAGLVKVTIDHAREYRAAVEQALACIDNAMARHTTPSDQLREFVRAYTAFHIDMDKEIELLMSLDRFLKSDALADIKHAKKQFDLSLEKLLVAGVECGEFKIANVPLTAQLIVGMISWPGRWRKSTGLSRDELGENLWEMVRTVVSAGASQPRVQSC